MKIVITGANSSVGINLLDHLGRDPAVESIIAGVRSEKAFNSLPSDAKIVPTVIAYDDAAGLEQAASGANVVIHLAGILIENKHSNYATANVAATAAVLAAAKANNAQHFIFISVIGARPDSKNAYYRSKGAAEKLAEESGLNVSILRTPLLLGPSTAGAWSLLGAAKQDEAKVLGGGHYVMHPLDIDDLSLAISNLCKREVSGSTTYELAGPEPIAYCDLIRRFATELGKEIKIGSVPIWLAKIGAAVTSIVKGGGISPTVIDVITTDEKTSHNADSELGVTLTPLQDTISKILRANS